MKPLRPHIRRRIKEATAGFWLAVHKTKPQQMIEKNVVTHTRLRANTCQIALIRAVEVTPKFSHLFCKGLSKLVEVDANASFHIKRPCVYWTVKVPGFTPQPSFCLC